MYRVSLKERKHQLRTQRTLGIRAIQFRCKQR